MAKTYWYHDSGSKKWQSAGQLPNNYSVDSTKKNSFYYNGPDARKANAIHIKKYGFKNKPVKKENK